MQRTGLMRLIVCCAVGYAAVGRMTEAAELDLLPSVSVGPSNIEVRLQQIASIGLPGDLAPVPDGSGRMLVADLTGTIYHINGGSVQTYHTMAGSQTKLDGDTAFTAIAFHPGFANPASPGYKKFYTIEPENAGTATATFSPLHSSMSSPYHHQDVLYEYTVADPSANTIGSFTKRQVIRANQSRHNHNFNDLVFDANGLMYIGVGDGGNNATERQNAPSLATVYGKVLRIDPLGLQGTPSSNGQYRIPTTNPFSASPGDVRKEIFTYGNRNPYRLSIDSLTGNLYVAEVGQDNIEEINLVSNVHAPMSGGQNFGWPVKEGSFLFPPNASSIPTPVVGLTDPVLEYDHEEGSDVIGGFVYRGAILPELEGKYVFADHQGPRDPEEPIPRLARLFYGDLSTGDLFTFNFSSLGDDLPMRIFSIGAGSSGELYVLGMSDVPGKSGVYAMLPPQPGDFNYDGLVDAADYVVWRKTLGDVANYNLWRANFNSMQGSGSSQVVSVPEPLLSLSAYLFICAAAVGHRRRR